MICSSSQRILRHRVFRERCAVSQLVIWVCQCEFDAFRLNGGEKKIDMLLLSVSNSTWLCISVAAWNKFNPNDWSIKVIMRPGVLKNREGYYLLLSECSPRVRMQYLKGVPHH